MDLQRLNPLWVRKWAAEELRQAERMAAAAAARAPQTLPAEVSDRPRPPEPVGPRRPMMDLQWAQPADAAAVHRATATCRQHLLSQRAPQRPVPLQRDQSLVVAQAEALLAAGADRADGREILRPIDPRLHRLSPDFQELVQTDRSDRPPKPEDPKVQIRASQVARAAFQLPPDWLPVHR